MKAVFEKLYEKYHQDLYQFIFYMVKDKEVCEDLVQEVYIKVLKSYDSFKGDSSEKTWLFSIARHVTIDFFRSVKRRRNRIYEFFDWDKNGSLLPDRNLLPDEITEQNEEIKRVYHYLDKCTPEQKSVLILRYIQSFTLQETAEILGFSLSKVKTTQHRAIKRLKKWMVEENQRGGDEL